MSGYLYRVKLSGGLCISLSPPSVSATLTVNASTTYYEDADGDGYYFNMQNSCTNPGGNWSTNPGSGGGDCNDGNADIHPGAAEICGNLIDENCNGMADDADVLFPVISGCPGTVTVNAALNASSAIASWTAPTASDDCTLASFTWTHNPGDNFPLGVTTVSYTASDLAGHITTCSFNVVVCASVTFNYSNLQVSCPEFTATLNAITAGLGYTYQWYNNNFAISGATVSTLNINNTGNYRVQISSGGCSNSSSPQYIHLSTPTLDTTGYVYTCAGNGYTINVSSSSLGSSYQWRKTDAPAGPVGTNSPAFTTTQPGNYVCDITYAGGCTKRSSSMVKLRNVPWACVMSKQGNEDEATPELSTTANMLELFPVPASEQLHVEVDISRLPVYELQITDLSGRVMHAGSHANEPTAVITVSQWPAGVYLLQLTNGDALHTRKLVVQH